MADITVGYKGSTIAEISTSGTTTLGTSGKYCEDDITLQYVKAASYVKLGEKEFTINQTSTNATSIGYIDISPASDLWTSAKMILVSVRDKAGKRNGYFLGTDIFFANPIPKNGSTDTSVACTSVAKMLYKVNSNGDYETSGVYTAHGVYAYDINNDGRVRIYARYNSTYSYTIDGTFKVEVWALKFPNNVSPFV